MDEDDEFDPEATEHRGGRPRGGRGGNGTRPGRGPPRPRRGRSCDPAGRDADGGRLPVVETAGVQGAPGWLVLGVAVGCYPGLFAIAVWPDSSYTAGTERDVDHGDPER